MTNISNSDNRIEISDIEARIEELREARDDLYESDAWNPGVYDVSEDAEELKTLELLFDTVDGDGDSLIRVSHWKRYIIDEWAQVVVDSNLPDLLKNNIDWQGAANDASSDHTSVDFDGVNYLVV
jgi:hypothetical protein